MMTLRIEEDIHVFGGHLDLVLAQGIEPAQRHARIGDNRLSGAQEFEFVTLLQDRAVVCRYIEAS